MEYTIWLSMKTVVQVALATYGLAIYIIVLMPLFKFRKILFHTPFYTICFAMAFADIGQQIRFVILCIRFPLQPYTDPFYLQFDGFLGKTFWYLVNYIELLIALERTLVVFSKPGSSRILNNTHVAIALVVIFVTVLATNGCILTDICKYIYNPEKGVVFYDTSRTSAMLHNKIVDWGIQPGLMSVTVILYLVTGIRIMKVRNKVQNNGTTNSTTKKSKMENRLFLLGLFVTLPHATIVILYHVMFYLSNAPTLLLQCLDFTTFSLTSLGLVLNPTLQLIVNKDLRLKTVQYWCSDTLSTIEKSSQLPLGSKIRNNLSPATK